MIEDSSCGLIIKQINEALERQLNNSLRAQDMTAAQLWVLLELNSEETGKLSFKMLEKRLRVAQSTISGIVSRLEQKGLVRGVVSPEDVRAKVAEITPEGVRCCRLSAESRTEAEKRLLSAMDEEEKEKFVYLLKKALDTLS